MIFFVSLWYWLLFLFFHFLFCLFGFSLSLFLTSLAEDFSILLMSGKKSAQLHWSFLLHLLGGVDGGLYFINILSDLYYFFILLTLGFVLTLSIGRLRCLFEIFLVDLYCYKLPCESCFSISHGFWQVVFLFPFVLRYFLTSSLISSLIHWFFF